jgi:hypothetical protein
LIWREVEHGPATLASEPEMNPENAVVEKALG